MTGVKMTGGACHGFLKVRVSGFLYMDFADPTDFFVFTESSVLSVRSVYRNWFLSSDNDKTIRCMSSLCECNLCATHLNKCRSALESM